MAIAKNTSELWDDVWSPFSEEQDRYNLEKKRNSIEWKRIRKIIIKEFGSFNGIKTIEIGAGQGVYSLLFALEGADVTVLDYSQKAIDSSKLFFKRNNINGNFIKMDGLNLDRQLFSKFDVSMSFGTAEHFSSEKRIKFIQSHLDVLKEGGVTFICVPNKWNLIYQLWKFLSRLFGKWEFGEEYPFSIEEFKKIGKTLNVKFEFIGAYLFDSHFLFSRRIKSFLGIKETYDTKKIRQQIGTPFDKCLSKDITAISKKHQISN
jgi:2-polyprenyl-3-methyl-5-hydroxy-6-metoxy-1,4-benzoquinol methylase